jgi:uncharacterized membrane protein YgcG
VHSRRKEAIVENPLWGLLDSWFAPLLVVAFVVAVVAFGVRRARVMRERNEALFVSMFPDLQPLYHPAKLFDYTVARLAQAVPRAGRVWKNPPGFAGLSADIRYEAEREVVRLLDAAGRLLTQFIFEEHPEGAAIRVGKGKFTLSTRDKAGRRVRYWHPDREFKWTPQMWKFKTPVAERAFESSDRGSSFSSESSSSSSSGVAAAAPFVAAGGAFDGGGASQSWSEGGAAGTPTTSY